MSRSWAGNIPVNRPGHPNDTLFFWAVEKETGSLTSTADDSNNEPWGIWLNGGGTGFSTVDETGFVADEDQMGEDFPYITKTYFGLENPPVKLTKIAIGDGTIGNIGEYEVLPAITIIETYPQLIGYDPAVFEYFKEQAHLCGLDLNLTYPQDGYFPTLNPLELPDSATAAPTNRILKATKARRLKRRLVNEAMKLDALASQTNSEVRSLKPSSRKFYKREQWKRDLSGRANGTIDPWYGCDLYDEVVDYALNFSLPWNHQTRAAIHAPTSKNWMESIFYPFNNTGPDPSKQPFPIAM
ncbi:hypothetical protein PHLCEN_2v12224 [Hermanssonia centrifuga]|uniref:Uncharacterized protein n=1 Tax=Hermanssonia centrifuga TaxID=98765 RepID=A0A2R6NHN5_9APHY|nr:hypothetical protein PHLCEN_2v12224 [Hermanssonia centrifuga]